MLKFLVKLFLFPLTVVLRFHIEDSARWNRWAVGIFPDYLYDLNALYFFYFMLFHISPNRRLRGVLPGS